MLNTIYTTIRKIIFIPVCILLIPAACDFKPVWQASAFESQVTELKADNNIDSLENELRMNPPSGVDLLHIYWDLSSSYRYASNYEKIRYYSRKGIALAEEIDSQYIAADLYKNLAISYEYDNKIDSAELYFDKALEILEQMRKENTGNSAQIAKVKGDVYGSIANRYSMQGKMKEALKYYFKALELFENHQISKEIATVFYNIGITYLDLYNNEQAETYLLKAKEIYRDSGYELDMAYVLTGLSYVCQNKKDFAGALSLAQEVIAISEKYNASPADMHSYYSNLSAIYLDGYGNDAKAMEYTKLALKEAKESKIPFDICNSLMQQAYILLFRKNYAEAKKSALKALQVDSTSLSLNQFLYECIAKANIGLGNTDKAFEYFDRFKQNQTMYANKNFQEQLSEMEVKYEIEKKELKIAVLEEEKQLMIWLGIMIGAVLLLATGLLSFRHRFDIQKRKLAENKIKQLEQEKQLVATQAILDGETQERFRLARDLHDGMGSMLTGVKLSLLEMKRGATLEYVDVECFDKALKLLDRSVQEMRRVAHHLMPDSLSRFGLKQSISDFCSNLPSVRLTYYGTESRLDPKLEVMIYRTIHELVNNAMKHAGADNIVVQIMQEPDRIAFTVQDDGCGFDLLTAKGMGLNNIRTRVASYNGIFSIDSEAGEGTEINIELKVD